MPISPVRPRRPRAAFTFIEVLVALTASALLVSVACSALVSSLRAEQTAARLREAGWLARQAALETYARPASTALTEIVCAGWRATCEDVELTDTTGPDHWRIWTFVAGDQPSLSASVAFRLPAE